MQTVLLRKSKNGCETCRARKVKCDEVRPACGNCKRRFTHINRCEYKSQPRQITDRLQKSAGGQNHTTPPESGSGNPPGCSPASPQALVASPPASIQLRPSGMDPQDSAHMLELRLMYHYTKSVCQEMPDCHGEPTRFMWEERIPLIAFQTRVVLEPMLALSALHLHSQYPTDTNLSLAVSRYMDKTVAKSLEAVSKSGELDEPLFLAAVVLVAVSWMLAHRLQPQNERYQLPLQPYYLVRGMHGLIVQKLDYLKGIGYGWYDEELPIVDDNAMQPEALLQIQHVQDDIDALMDGFNVRELPDDVRVIYEDTARFVVWLYKVYFSGVPEESVHRFIATTPLRGHPRFLRLLKNEEPLALALLARSLVLLKSLRYVWWTRGAGEYEVMYHSVDGMASLMPNDYLWAMDWPRKILTGEIVLTRQANNSHFTTKEITSMADWIAESSGSSGY